MMFGLVLLAMANVTLPPTALPSQLFGLPYATQKFVQGVQLAFTFNPVTKVKLMSRFAAQDLNASVLEAHLGHANVSASLASRFVNESGSVTSAIGNTTPGNETEARDLEDILNATQTHTRVLSSLLNSSSLPAQAREGLGIAINSSEHEVAALIEARVRARLNVSAALNESSGANETPERNSVTTRNRTMEQNASAEIENGIAAIGNGTIAGNASAEIENGIASIGNYSNINKTIAAVGGIGKGIADAIGAINSSLGR